MPHTHLHTHTHTHTGANYYIEVFSKSYEHKYKEPSACDHTQITHNGRGGEADDEMGEGVGEGGSGFKED